MRRSRRFRFENLVAENKRDLENNKEMMEKIERRMEERRSRRSF